MGNRWYLSENEGMTTLALKTKTAKKKSLLKNIHEPVQAKKSGAGCSQKRAAGHA